MSIQNTLESVKPEEIESLERKYGISYYGLDDVQKEYYVLAHRYGNSIVDHYKVHCGCMCRE